MMRFAGMGVRIACTLVACLAAGIPVWAQTLGELRGTVVDPAGAPLAGVTVAVSGAGPTLLAIVPEGLEAAVGRAVVAAYEEHGASARLHFGGVDPEGARLE